MRAIRQSHGVNVSFAASSGVSSAVLDALFLPLAHAGSGLPERGRGLFLRARAGAWQHVHAHMDWHCEQTFKPFADALVRSGARVEPCAADATFPLVVMLPPRQREEARALYARAVHHAREGGVVVAAIANNEGARSGEGDLARLAGPLRSLSKHKCRVFWTRVDGARVDHALREEWLATDVPRPIAGGRFMSRPGLFAWDRIDPASALLAAQLPPTLAGRVGDLGGGYGFLSCEVLRRCAGVGAIDLYEAEARALEPARMNLERAVRERGGSTTTEVIWHDVTAGLARRYDAIVMNPPFHQGRAEQPELGQAFIAAAADALEPHGSVWLVANRHLPYEAMLAARFARVDTRVVEKGFKVIHASAVRA